MQIAEVRRVEVTLDIPEAELAAICACIAVVDDLPLTVREEDTLRRPQHKDESTELRRFDRVLAKALITVAPAVQQPARSPSTGSA
jgi:hypothetical protein